MSNRLQDHVIVVTGAAGGQGAAEVAALHDEGAVVIATDLHDVDRHGHERIHARTLDVADPAAWRELSEWLADRFEHVDGLINNAGTTSRARLAEVAVEDWNRALAINLVAGGDLLEGAARETLELIEADGGTGSSTRLDVTDEASVGEWVEAAAARFGRIDVLYANAGAARFGAVDEQPVTDWRFTLAAELDSVFLTARAAWPHLRRSHGVIIAVGSTAGLRGSLTNQRAAHTASKGGVIALTRQLAAEGAAHGIRAVCISPGMIATEGSRENLLAPDHPMRAIAASIPLGRLGTPEDIVAAAVFLAGDEASYITGANLVIDGGWSSVLPGGQSTIEET